MMYSRESRGSLSSRGNDTAWDGVLADRRNFSSRISYLSAALVEFVAAGDSSPKRNLLPGEEPDSSDGRPHFVDYRSVWN